MKEAEATKNRRSLPLVLVDPSRVQESGLVKDTLVLDIPDEAGNFDSVLVRRAARKLKVSTERWAEYTIAQGLLEVVHPLLVIQTPNTPTRDDVGVALDTIFAEYPELCADSVRHVLGDHSIQKFGAWRSSGSNRSACRTSTTCGSSWPRCDLDRLGLPARRGPCVVPSGEGQHHITQLLGEMVAARSRAACRVTSA